jgi:hypothetical protein
VSSIIKQVSHWWNQSRDYSPVDNGSIDANAANYTIVKKTYANFIGDPDENGNLRKSILWFAFKRLFFHKHTDEKTYNLLKTLNRVLEHEQHCDVFKNYFSDPNTNKENLEAFQAYILLVVKKLNKQYRQYLAKAQADKNTGKPRAARQAAHEAAELKKILADFKKYHNRWARHYDLTERICHVQENEIPNGYGFEKNHDTHEKAEKREMKARLKPFALSLCVIFSAGYGFFAFSGVIGFGVTLFPAMLIGITAFIVNFYIVYYATANVFKFRTWAEVGKALFLGADTMNGKTQNEPFAITIAIAMLAWGLALAFALTNAACTVATLTLWPVIPIEFVYFISSLIAVITAVVFSTVTNSILRDVFHQIKDFFTPHIKHIENYFAPWSDAMKPVEKATFILKTSLLVMKWIAFTITILPLVMEIFFRSQAYKELQQEWQEILAISDPQEKIYEKLKFRIDMALKVFMWPALIVTTTVIIISFVSALHMQIASFLQLLPIVSPKAAGFIATGIIAIAALPEATFDFSTMRSTCGRLINVIASIIAAPIKACYWLGHRLSTSDANQKEQATWIDHTAEEIDTFRERLWNDPWKTFGSMWETVKTGGLYSACGVNAGASGAFFGIEGQGLFETAGLSKNVAIHIAGGAGAMEALATGEAFSDDTITMTRPIKVSIEKAEGCVDALTGYQKECARSRFFTTREKAGENFFDRAHNKRESRAADYLISAN